MALRMLLLPKHVTSPSEQQLPKTYRIQNIWRVAERWADARPKHQNHHIPSFNNNHYHTYTYFRSQLPLHSGHK